MWGMEPRTSKNTFAFLLLIPEIWDILNKMLHYFGDVRAAQDAENLINVHGIAINWHLIYHWLFLAGLVIIFAINFDILSDYLQRRRQSKIRYWNVPIASAINWIANFSYHGKSLNHDDRYISSLNSLLEKAREGKISIAGIHVGKFNQQKIPKKALNNLILSYSVASGGLYGSLSQGEIQTAELQNKSNEKKSMWTSLAVDKNELERVWPFEWKGGMR